MSCLRQAIVLVGFCSAACAVPTSDESGGDDGAALRSVQQAGSAEAEILHMSGFSSGDEASMNCPSGTPFALSLGVVGIGNAEINDMYFDANDGDPVAVYGNVVNDFTDFLLVGVCSDYTPSALIGAADNDGDKVVNCPANHVVIGGGASCSTSSAKLTRSRPNPDTAGSEPTGWRATCSTGRVNAIVNCANKAGSNNWNGCKTRKHVVTDDWRAGAVCNTGELAVAAGAYCGNGGHIMGVAPEADLEETHAHCSEDVVTSYAVCCPGVFTED